VSTELFPGNGCCTVTCVYSCYLAMDLHVKILLIKTMDLEDIRLGCVNLINLAQVEDETWALVNMVMNLRLP
jgi:hypothetical protein